MEEKLTTEEMVLLQELVSNGLKRTSSTERQKTYFHLYHKLDRMIKENDHGN